MNIDWVDLFLKPSGRTGQKEFWIGIAIIIVINIIINNFIAPHAGTIGNVLGLLMIWPGYCVLSSRFKDMGKPPWLAMLPYALIAAGYVLGLVAALGAGTAAATGNGDAAVAGGLIGGGLALMCLGIGGLLGLIFLIWAGIGKGDPGPNQYGPPPADPTMPKAS